MRWAILCIALCGCQTAPEPTFVDYLAVYETCMARIPMGSDEAVWSAFCNVVVNNNLGLPPEPRLWTRQPVRI